MTERTPRYKCLAAEQSDFFDRRIFIGKGDKLIVYDMDVDHTMKELDIYKKGTLSHNDLQILKKAVPVWRLVER